MKPLIPFRQSPGLCGPASLKILLSYYDKHFPEDELAKLCEVTPEIHASHAQMASGAEAVKAKVESKSEGKLDDLRRYVEDDIPVIVGWWSNNQAHYSVVYEVGKTRVFMMDPDTESGIRIMPLEEFEAAWHDTDGGPKHPIKQWMMAITNWKPPIEE
ncbi:hypothetical protein COX00_04865 [Candidatus Uhrbacteria bacterium CG22_combo_CG10-13_8_21_14_all_47_17]|uniref:Peptidase C39 domain-containing protein n=1 Tax=Candidatus Uhrbacteria bacterium CG22_combo_CG10-13_8_21_14_all_47_17 TaxID=1975041 RepID=A0A2H0BR57_9BACT|nr:MAG: hypothetical protein COX00_04865 [Candidatus Uhrbacteria bacterium CG22_combo_CG10-13_8_21_14_all_47_17]